MSDDKAVTGSSDAAGVDVNKDDEVDRWAQKFDVSAQQIRDAVKAVGDRAADVEMHLKGSHATTNADQEARADGIGKVA